MNVEDEGLTGKRLEQGSPKYILGLTAVLSAIPFLLIRMAPLQLEGVIEKSSYLVFHNITEFFSIMVSLSIFGVGWFAYEQSRDKRALFLGVVFLVTGLLDFMHTFSNVAMPDFISANTTNKSTQFWITARLFNASAFLLGAFVYPDRQSWLLSKRFLMTSALAFIGLTFTGIVFFPSYLPATAVAGIGLTPLKRILELVVILLLILAVVAYWRRMARTGDRLIIYYLAAFIICIFSEAVFASYRTGFDTYNVLGHIYKVIAFYLIYKGVFASSVGKPYVELFDSNKKLLGEITERRKAEEELRRYQDHLEELVKERTRQLLVANDNLQMDIAERRKAEADVLKLSEDMAARNLELENVNRELEAFIYSVSHDLRAPLRTMAAFVGFLSEDCSERLDEQAREYLSRISRSSAKMSRLIEDLLNLSRLSRQEVSRTQVDMSAIAASVVSGLREADPGRSVRVSIEGGLSALADPLLIEAVLSNLIGNAWKFTSKTADARIEIGAAEKDGQPVYYVKDNGAGFDPEYSAKMFQPFHRLHSSDDFEGTGIGLAIVERIIRRHSGRVWAEGEAGKGATVYFTLR